VANLSVALHSQQALDEHGRFHSHQWVEVPDELSVIYMTGGLKRVRRMLESYCAYTFTPEARKWVHGLWRKGEPWFRLRYLRQPLIHLGRLRQTGTTDVYRGHFEVLGGAMVARQAIDTPAEWPHDMPWVAPSAGEFDIQAESVRPPYLGIFEARVYRQPTGCSVHLFVRDFPPVRGGLRAKLWSRAWMPLTRIPNLHFLQMDVRSIARQENHTVLFEMREHDGVPEPLRPIRPVEAALLS